MASEEMPEMVQTGDEFPDGRTGGSGDKRLPPAGAVGSATTPSDGHIWSSNTIEAADSLGKAADKTTARQWVMAGSQKKLAELLRGGGDVQACTEKTRPFSGARHKLPPCDPGVYSELRARSVDLQ